MSSYGAHWIGLPGHWTDEHRHIHGRFGGSRYQIIDLLTELIKYRRRLTDKNYPKEVAEKTIEVLEFILEKEHDVPDIDLAIEQARDLGAIP